MDDLFRVKIKRRGQEGERGLYIDGQRIPPWTRLLPLRFLEVDHDAASAVFAEFVRFRFGVECI